MKIKSVSKPHIIYYVETDAPDFPEYRTDGTGTHWENAMGESWEQVYNDEELKKLFEEFMEGKK